MDTKHILLTGVILYGMLASFTGFWSSLATNPDYATSSYVNTTSNPFYSSIQSNSSAISGVTKSFIDSARSLNSNNPGTITFSILSLIANGLFGMVYILLQTLVYYADIAGTTLTLFSLYVNLSPLVAVVITAISVFVVFAVLEWIGAVR